MARNELSKLAKDIKPYVIPWIEAAGLSGGGGGGASGGAGVSDHGLLTGLGDNDHPQYLLRSGASAMFGDLDLGGNNIDNVGLIEGFDINGFSGTLTSLQTAVDQLETRTVLAGDGIDSDGVLFGAGSPTVAVDVSDLVGDGLRDDGSNNFAVNPADFAGSGLMAASYDLHVGAGDGITVGANDVAVDESYDFEWTGDHTFAATLGSPSYISGFTGGGWRIDSDDASMELNDLTVRGLMRVYELLIQQIRVTNGSLFIAPGAKVASVQFIGGTTYDLIFDADEDDTDVQPFVANDLIRAKRWTGQGTYESSLRVSSVNVGGNPLKIRTTLESGDAPVAGMDFVRLGNPSDADRQGSIYLSSDDNEAPFIDIVDGVSSFAAWAGTSKVKVRLGKLNGITDADMGVLTGYGLYTQNAFLRGTFAAGGGNVWVTDLNGLTLKSTSGAGDGSAWITFHTDPSDPDTANRTGFMSASKVDSGGTVYGTLQMYVGRGLTNTTDVGQIVLDSRDESDGYDSLIRVSSGMGAHEITISAYKSAGDILGAINVVGHGSWEGNIIPGLDSAYDLGSNSVRWRRIYADEIIAGTSSTIDTGHTHTEFLTEAEILALLAGKAPVVHTHAGYVTSTSLATTLADYVDDTALALALADYTTTVALTALLANKSPVGHNHDTRYYTETEIDGMLAELSAAVHDHNTLYYTETEIDGMLADYVLADDLATTLGSYVTTAGLTSTLTAYPTSAALTAILAGYSPTTHDHTTLPLSTITYDGDTILSILSDGTLRSPNYVSGRSGYSLGPDGLEVSNADVRGTIRSGMLQAQGTLWTYGTQLFGPSGKIIEELEITAPGTQVTVAVADDDAGHAAVFGVGEILKLSGPAYVVTDSNSEGTVIEPWVEFVMATGVISDAEIMVAVWLEVDSISDQVTHYEYTCTVRYGPRSIWSPGAVIGSYGTATTGRIAITSDALYAPYLDLFTTGETPWQAVISHLRLGKLDGLAVGAGDRTAPEYGLAAAADLSDSDAGWLIASNRRVKGYNLDLAFVDGDMAMTIDAAEGIVWSNPMASAGTWVTNSAALTWYDSVGENTTMYVGPYYDSQLFDELSIIATHHESLGTGVFAGNYEYAAYVRLAAEPSSGSPGTRKAEIRLQSTAVYYQETGGLGGDEFSEDSAYVNIRADDGVFISGPVRVNTEINLPDRVNGWDLPRSTFGLPSGFFYADASGYVRMVL